MFGVSDTSLLLLSWLGLLLSLIIIIGYANSILMFIIWFLYMSFVHIGQLWYSFGWEIQLLETGFLAIFIVPLLDARPFPKTPPPVPMIWLLRWLTFRMFMGAGLIKIRGDSCWRDLTCLFYHYETQPIPNPLSPWFHFVPKWLHKLGVLWNHFIELIVPFFVFWPRIGRHIAGILLVTFQFFLILSGNLSFLNWLTIVATIGCFDDTLLRRVLPRWITKKADKAAKNAKFSHKQFIISWILVVVIAILSISVVQNLFSSSQIMNTSFNQLHLVNTYGAFGSVGKQRLELVVEGTQDQILTQESIWEAYEFKAKPTDINRALPIIAPYHLRVDWLIWFAAMSDANRHPWMIHLVWKFLHNDPLADDLISNNPFEEKPPEYVRVDLYRYSFVDPWQENEAVWKRERLGTWLPPLSKSNPELQRFIRANNWD